MPNLSVVPIAWAGAPVVGPGVSVMHCQAGDEDSLLAAARTMFVGVSDQFPTGLQWSFPAAGVTLDEATGNVVSTWTATGVHTAVPATNGATWTNGVGLRIKWPTIGVVHSRHVTGSTFMVPLVISAYEGAGNIKDSILAQFQLAASTFAAVPNALRIYSRKTSLHAGISFPVNAAIVPDKVSWLRGRRT